MPIISPDSKLCDVVINDSSVIPVFNRFGILFGLGDKTVQCICEEKELDLHFFLAILNTYINAEYFPEKILKSFSAEKIIDYLNKNRQFQIPNIEQHFRLLISRSNENNTNLELMQRFFLEVKQELLARIDNDNKLWFPEILRLEKACHVSDKSIDNIAISFDNNETDTVEDKLSDLISMIVIHLSGSYDLNLCNAVLISIFSLKKDISQNNRIRNRILSPLSKAFHTSQNK